MRIDTASTNDSEESNTGIPQLRVSITPQGSSDISLELTSGPHSSSPLAAAPSQEAQQQYQEQLRKARETLLPQTDVQVAFCMHHTHADSVG